ncbi:MAG: 3-dehydroquinate synthase [Planctomycetes bacterium]|nr:3-dehydroquinate synthase [Planctomycetota bacterium]
MLPAGEAAKALGEVERMWEFFGGHRLDRRSAVVALGGGAVGDSAGFAAATWMRGVPLVHVPTTLLAMSDSAVGGKTAIDLPAGKNLVGAVHMPAAVVADTDTLATLPDREFRSGFAEIVKCALLADRPRLASLAADAPRLVARDPAALADAISFAVGVKLDHVRGDERDLSGRRALLNLGHTVGHAIEREAGFGTWLHGEAVAAGTVVACRVAEGEGLSGPDVTDAARAALSAFGLPTGVPESLRVADLVERTRADKKSEGGRRRMVLPRREAGAETRDVPDAALESALRKG